MLQNPSAYLEQRNKALQDRATNNENIYREALDAVVKTVTGKVEKKDPAYIVASWVKSLACDVAAKIATVDIAVVDIQFPMLGSTYKAQKSKNSRELEANKEFIKEGIK